MIRTLTTFAAAAALSIGAAGCTAMMDDGMSSDVAYVGGAAMYPTQTIVQNAVNSPIHTTLVQLVQAADLVDTLNGAGPFTVFAPTDEAFGRVPSATVTMLTQPQNKAALQSVLTYHVVPGRVTAAQLMQMIRDGGGSASIRTVNGQNLTATMEGSYVKLTGMGGSTAYVSQADVMQSNGVIHVVNGVLTPNL